MAKEVELCVLPNEERVDIFKRQTGTNRPVDCVEKEALPLGGVEGWFRAALGKCSPKVEVKTVRASDPDCEKEVGWADAVMISGSPRDAFAEDEWTHALMAKAARLLEKKKPVLGVCYGHQIPCIVTGKQIGRAHV